MAKIETLAVEFFANNTQFNKGIEQVQTKLAALQKVINKVSLKAASMFVHAQISTYVEQATAFSDLSKSIGENAEEVQAWSQAVLRSNGNIEAFEGTLLSLSDSLNSLSIEGNGPLIGYLNRLNIHFKNMDGSIKKPLQLLKELAQQFEGMSHAKSMSIGKKLGLDEGTIRLLQQGTRGVCELIDKSKALGVYTQKEIEMANKLSQSFHDFNQAFNIFGLRIASFFIPFINKTAQFLTKLVVLINKNERAVHAFVSVALIGSMLKAIPVMTAFAKVLWASILPISALVGSLLLLGLAFEDAFTFLEGGDSLTGKIAQWFSDVGFAFEDFIKKIFDLFKNTGFALEDFIKKIFDLFINIGFAFENFIKSLVDLLLGGIKSAFDTIADLWESAKNFLGNFFKGENNLKINASSSIPQDMLNSQNLRVEQIRNQNINIGTIDVRADKIDASNIVSTPMNEIKKNSLVNMADGTLNG